ncbi:phosphatase PAP2 family protein [Streptomyces sp. NPDC005438]|uniref:phosphatase PAP2 family protein n=1 Tax=Streptomyces sp. NPDC005438 TaxID=3156880 RepID=UPI0033A02435
MEDALYRSVTEFARDTPGWVRHLAEMGTEGGLLLLATLLLAGWWRARRGDARAIALAVLAPLAVLLAYAVSEVAKVAIEEERPCRAVPGAVQSVAPCPEVGDWSFPSNHATLAVGSATAIFLSWRVLAWLAVPVGLLTAFSRVFLGVHYPHDVLAGAALGALTVAVVVAAGLEPAAQAMERLRDGPLRPLLQSTPRARSHARPR